VLELLAFGEVPPPDPTSGAGALFEEFHLAPLTETARELAAAERYVRGPHRMLTGPAASEAAYRSSAGEPAAIVHIAAHALVDERPGRGAAILLAPDGADDGLVHPDEIVADAHRASLTVLAACRSAADVLGGGRALNNLTGALLASGSKAVLATLWEVDDATTAAFMEQFYYEIGRGSGAAEALRAVKLRLRADSAWTDPSLWSGYVLIGEAREPLVPERFGARVIALIAGVVLVAGAVTWLALRRRRA
jgi:CHAT domain-containing protein